MISLRSIYIYILYIYRRLKNKLNLKRIVLRKMHERDMFDLL